GESYTNRATFVLPSAIEGDFHLIVKADTDIARDIDPLRIKPASSLRAGLDTVAQLQGQGAGAVAEFRGEGNNVARLALPITLATPPDLQVATVQMPQKVVAGQPFRVDYRVENRGGATPADQGSWTDLIYLSKDRFLDLSKDQYLGYVQHEGGLAAQGGYDAHLDLKAPFGLDGSYYLFVVSDPARYQGSGAGGRVLEGDELNNAGTAAQPLLIETPPPADLVAQSVSLKTATVQVGDEVELHYTVKNDSTNPARGRWTDAVYLSADGQWDISDILLGKLEHIGDLEAGKDYAGTLKAKLPPLKDGSWRLVVRPDIYNEVFEGEIRYDATGLHRAPGEQNNLMASAQTLTVTVPSLVVASPLALNLNAGQSQLYKVSVAAGETLRVSLDAASDDGENEIYLRYGEVPTGHRYDAAYSRAAAADQQAVIPSTQAGDYYVLVRSRNKAGSPAQTATLKAELMPLAITRVTPDAGGTGDDQHRWVTMDIEGARFKPGALVKLSRPGVFEVQPERWQVLDATHIRAVFDLRQVPHGLYDLQVLNPDGQVVTEAYRYLVERGIEADVTLGIGGARTLNPGETGSYSVSLQNLSNVDTPYVKFNVGAPAMGDNPYLLSGLNLPFFTFASNVGGQPDGRTLGGANTQTTGASPVDGTPRRDIPWAVLDSMLNQGGFNLTPGYAFDVAARGFVGATVNIATYPGLAEWINYDFEGLRDKLYRVRPDWKAEGRLDGGINDLDKLAEGLAARFRSLDPKIHLNATDNLAMPFRFNLVGAATPLTRDEFIADQLRHAEALRTAILQDAQAPIPLQVLASDKAQWGQGWLGALEAAGLLRPLDEAPPIRADGKVMSLTATLATGLLLGRGGEQYRTQADLVSFFSKVQQWYGDTPQALAPVDYEEYRAADGGNAVAISPVPVAPKAADYRTEAAHATHFLSLDVFAGGLAEMEYLRNIGLLDQDFKPIGPKALNLAQYLQQAAQNRAAETSTLSLRGPQVLPNADGVAHVPVATPLPYTVSFQNPTDAPAGELRIVSQIDPGFDLGSLRLNDLKLGDINVHVPDNRSDFGGDFDFSDSHGFILRVSAGVDPASRTLSWLIQAIDPETGEVLKDATRGLLRPDAGQAQSRRGFVSYTLQARDDLASGSRLRNQARLLFNGQPPIDSEAPPVSLDAAAPRTTVQVASAANTADGAPQFDISWQAQDDASGVRHVTVYVSTDGGDFRLWQKQVVGASGQARFVGEAGKHYEFLAVATDVAGNREAANLLNAVLPDDGSAGQTADSLGRNETLSATAPLPAAKPDRTYATNALFQTASQRLPGLVVPQQAGDLQSVLAPFSSRSFGSGFSGSQAHIGALAMVELADGRVLASAGEGRNAVYAFAKDGGRSLQPLFSLNEPVLDMALDRLGQLWVMTGRQLLQVDAGSGQIVQRLDGPGGNPLTHALAIDRDAGQIYASSGQGIERYDLATGRWQHVSNVRVGDLALGPDGRLWGVRWTGSQIDAAAAQPQSEIVSIALSGRNAGRAEVEYRLDGVLDSLAFGRAGSALDGLLLVSSNGHQQALGAGRSAARDGALWMIELASRRSLQLANGGSRGESLLTTADGRILLAQTGQIDEIAPQRPPKLLAGSVPDGALVPLPLSEIRLRFDQAMYAGDTAEGLNNEPGSVLNPEYYTLVSGEVRLQPTGLRWDAASQSVILSLPSLEAGHWRLEVSDALQNSGRIKLAQGYVSQFTSVLDFSSRVQLTFSNTRAHHATGQVSYDVSLRNIGTDDLKGPLTLLLDPGRYFGDAIAGARRGSGEQSDLWLLDLSAALKDGKLAAGETLADQTVTLVPAERFGTAPGSGPLVKANLGHGVYALPYQNVPPQVSAEIGDGIAVSTLRDLDTEPLPTAQVGQAWTATLVATDPDSRVVSWQILDGPAGLSLTASAQGVRVEPPLPGTDTAPASTTSYYKHTAQLSWTPSASDLAQSEIRVRVIDSRGGVAIRRFAIDVAGGNHGPVIDAIEDIRLTEGEALALPLTASDADGDALTLTVRNLPAGASFDASRGVLHWTPSYDQAGDYRDIAVVASDGKTTSVRRFNLRVAQGYAAPVLRAPANQTLREGERFSLQLAGSLPGGLRQADGTTIRLQYSSPWLPAGATLNPDTGWFDWTPGYNQHGHLSLPLTLTATYTPADGSAPVSTRVSQTLEMEILNANGAPRFAPAEHWQLLEGQPLRLSVFAFDPDNPDFEPKLRLRPEGAAVGGEGRASVEYDVQGLPPGARFDKDTLELIWTPGYTQAGTYEITVIATDDGDGTGSRAISRLTVPITVRNANRAPEVGDLTNASLEIGQTLRIPVSARDADGNPLTLSLSSLPRFARFEQTSPTEGVIIVTPQEGDRGDYPITVTAQDNGDGEAGAALAQSKRFVLSVTHLSEAPQIRVARQAVAVAGQPLRLPIRVNDPDQDALSYRLEGAPAGAQIETDPQYGLAWLVWTPSADQIGNHDLSLLVSDSGLPPAGNGQTLPADFVPQLNTRSADLRLIVRGANQLPTLLALQADGQPATALAADRSRVMAREGQPLTLDWIVTDPDLDLLHWTVEGLPAGMTLEPSQQGSQNRLRLVWTPGLLAAQSSNRSDQADGHYRLTLRGSDGMATIAHTVEIEVVNTNQAPQLLPMPLQLVREGETLSFRLTASDADRDAVQLDLLMDETTPKGVRFDPASGTFEWTPDADTVDHLNGNDRAFPFRFRASDGQTATVQTVQVRVLDLNRAPVIQTSSHALVVGQSFSLPVVRTAPSPAGEGGGSGNQTGTLPNTSTAPISPALPGATPSLSPTAAGSALPGLQITDLDGAAQTAALSVRFNNLPEGATFDGQTLHWTPGPGQIGDVLVTAEVSDGRSTTRQTFVLRVVAEASANAPTMLIDLTPATPVLPGQSVLATVRADGFAAIREVKAAVRGAGFGSDWQPVALDTSGRLRLPATVAGLIELQITATDVDGFSTTRTQSVRVRDPQDSAAPQLAWAGALKPADQAPATLSTASLLQARLDETQLMGWRLQLAPLHGEWTTLADAQATATAQHGLLDLATLDPRQYANGVYRLRLTAWDLAGRQSEIDSRLIVDSADKQAALARASDGLFQLGGHTLALNRELNGQTSSADAGNWQLPLFQSRLSHDQTEIRDSGSLA
ncbi:putative Ig domain-containing protein, partial [Parachitinimonas caeni]